VPGLLIVKVADASLSLAEAGIKALTGKKVALSIGTAIDQITEIREEMAALRSHRQTISTNLMNSLVNESHLSSSDGWASRHVTDFVSQNIADGITDPQEIAKQMLSQFRNYVADTVANAESFQDSLLENETPKNSFWNYIKAGPFVNFPLIDDAMSYYADAQNRQDSLAATESGLSILHTMQSHYAEENDVRFFDSPEGKWFLDLINTEIALQKTKALESQMKPA
jgi:hypothetical protein